jgi:hypothetical protein
VECPEFGDGGNGVIATTLPEPHISFALGLTGKGEDACPPPLRHCASNDRGPGGRENSRLSPTARYQLRVTKRQPVGPRVPCLGVVVVDGLPFGELEFHLGLDGLAHERFVVVGLGEPGHTIGSRR